MPPTLPPAVLDRGRLAAVRATGLLDTSAEPGFDRLTGLAATLLEAPLAFVTLVDDRRSFWKSCLGTGLADDDVTARQNTVQESFCQYVVASREPLVVGDTRLDPRTRDNPSIQSMGVLAWAGFPVMSADGHVLGSFCVVDTVARTWSDRDVEVLRVLSLAAAGEFAVRTALAQARAAERTATALARTLQESLLPPLPPQVPGLDVAARYRPAGSGSLVVGDFFDVFSLGGRAGWAAAIGDVSGKGVEAAKVAALARHTIRGAALAGSAPGRVLAALNDALLAQDAPPADAEPRFLTATYAHLRVTATGAVTRLASAGHCATLVRRADGRLLRVPSTGLPLGWFAGVEPAPARIVLRPGDCLVLHSDGVTEARRDGRLFGDDGLDRTLAAVPLRAGAAAVAEAVEHGALAHGGSPPADDTAVLVVAVPSR